MTILKTEKLKKYQNNLAKNSFLFLAKKNLSISGKVFLIKDILRKNPSCLLLSHNAF